MNKIKNITKIKTFLQNKQKAGRGKTKTKKIKYVSRVKENTEKKKEVIAQKKKSKGCVINTVNTGGGLWKHLKCRI